MEERRRLLRDRLDGILADRANFVWEIGCGHGHFLTAYARAHPAQLCVGIDIEGGRIDRANRKRERAALANLFFLRAEARLFLEVMPLTARLAAIYLLFPDPWPKKRHHKHRLMQADFLSAVAPRMEPAARLYFRTDFKPYFDGTQALLRAHPDWRLDEADTPWQFEHETVFQSRALRHYSLSASVRRP